MAIYALGELEPTIDPTAYVHPDAVVIGAVTIGAQSSIWPCAVLRGDSATITVGSQTSIQDGAVIHVAPGVATVIGSRVTVGHLAHIEGATIEDEALIGVGSIVLHRAVVHHNAVVGAGAVVTPDTRVPASAMALGVPARIKENAVEPGFSQWNIETYINNARIYPGALRRIDG